MTFGSGKLGTACERMHLANASAPANLPCPVRPLLLLVGLAEPQAAIATAQPSAASPTDIRRPWPLRVLIVVVLCTSLAAGADYPPYLRCTRRALTRT